MWFLSTLLEKNRGTTLPYPYSLHISIFAQYLFPLFIFFQYTCLCLCVSCYSALQISYEPIYKYVFFSTLSTSFYSLSRWWHWRACSFQLKTWYTNGDMLNRCRCFWALKCLCLSFFSLILLRLCERMCVVSIETMFLYAFPFYMLFAPTHTYIDFDRFLFRECISCIKWCCVAAAFADTLYL